MPLQIWLAVIHAPRNLAERNEALKPVTESVPAFEIKAVILEHVAVVIVKATSYTDAKKRLQSVGWIGNKKNRLSSLEQID